MYLTRLRLDPSSGKARRDLADAYEMHRTLVRAFVSEANQTPPRFLWRLESQGAWVDPVLLVQSAHSADWSYLEALDRYLKSPAEIKEVPLDGLLNPDGRYRFRMRANPTVTREGKRLGLVGEEAQLAWLGRQGVRHGFRIDAAMVTGSEVLAGRKGDTRMRVRWAMFEGVLCPTDSTVLKQALLDGIGPAKAFGCGLMSLARCR